MAPPTRSRHLKTSRAVTAHAVWSTSCTAVEVAFVVADGWQNRGLGTILFRRLMDAARARGVVGFRAWVLADNTRMLDLIARLGDVHARTLEQGVVELVFSGQRPAPASRD